VIAASDHTSTHISYGMLWVEDLTREGVMEALRARRSYGATDNILLDVRIGEHLNGSRLAHRGGPVAISISVHGTAPVARVVVFRNEAVVQTLTPGSVTVDTVYSDTPEPGPARYYVRVEQVDGNIAWSSPFWIDVIDGTAQP